MKHVIKPGSRSRTASSRRSFILGGFALAGGAAAVGVPPPAMAPDYEAARSPAGGTSGGYRETEHIRTYYASTRD